MISRQPSKSLPSARHCCKPRTGTPPLPLLMLLLLSPQLTTVNCWRSGFGSATRMSCASCCMASGPLSSTGTSTLSLRQLVVPANPFLPAPFMLPASCAEMAAAACCTASSRDWGSFDALSPSGCGPPSPPLAGCEAAENPPALQVGNLVCRRAGMAATLFCPTWAGRVRMPIALQGSPRCRETDGAQLAAISMSFSCRGCVIAGVAARELDRCGMQGMKMYISVPHRRETCAAWPRQRATVQHNGGTECTALQLASTARRAVPLGHLSGRVEAAKFSIVGRRHMQALRLSPVPEKKSRDSAKSNTKMRTKEMTTADVVLSPTPLAPPVVV